MKGKIHQQKTLKWNHLRKSNTLGRFSANLLKGDTFCVFLFAVLHTRPSVHRVNPKRKESPFQSTPVLTRHGKTPFDSCLPFKCIYSPYTVLWSTVITLKYSDSYHIFFYIFSYFQNGFIDVLKLWVLQPIKSISLILSLASPTPLSVVNRLINWMQFPHQYSFKRFFRILNKNNGQTFKFGRYCWESDQIFIVN